VAEQNRRPGRFSETFAPERRSMARANWPESDKVANERACRVGDAFEGSSPAARWAPETRSIRERHYGRFLNFLGRNGLLLETEGPADRMTPERLSLYLAEASQLLSARTIEVALIELSQALHAMVPEKDWRWICRHPGRPRRKAVRASRQPKASFDARVVCCMALDLMDEISASVPVYGFHVLYRNALIVVIQCLFALRRRNLVETAIGRNLIIGDDVIHLVFTAEETKTDMPIRCTIPDFIKPYLFTYLHTHRAVLLNGNVCDALWISAHKRALDYDSVPLLFDSIGRRLLGHPINCHAFRHSTVTTILTNDPRKTRMAAGMLTHRSSATVIENYDLSGDAASRQAWDKLRRDILRGRGLDRPHAVE
jgi:hypothetical protein